MPVASAENLVEQELEAVPDLELYTVRTPEMVEFSFQLAGPGTRFMAWLIDSAILMALGAAVTFILMIIGIGAAFVAGSGALTLVALWYLLIFLLRNFYAIYFEMKWNGQTPGKRVFSLRVLGENGVRLTLTQSIIRNLLRAVDSLPGIAYVPALVSMAVTEHSQRVGDVLAGTVVIREDPRPLPEELKLPQAKYNTLLSDPTFVYRCARAIKPNERELLVEVVQRRDELSLEARTRLFEVLCKYFQDRLGVSADLHLSQEKWVLNLTQALLESERQNFDRLR